MHFRRSLVFAISLCMIAMGLAHPRAKAQNAQQPLAIISIAPLDGVLQETTYLLQACNFPEFGGVVSILANQYTQGVDRSKPIGIAVTLEGQTPTGLIFLPMVDRSKFFSQLAGVGIVPDDLGGGVFEINVPGQSIFAKDAGGWLFIAQTESALSTTPQDPAAMLGQLPQQYNLAVQVNVQALPADLREMVTEQLRIGFERGMAEQRDQTEEERATAEDLGQSQIAQIEQLINETEQFIVGLKIDQGKQKVFLDTGARFVPGSKLAEQASALQNLVSNYTALPIPESAVNFRFTAQVSEKDKVLAKQNLRTSMARLDKQLNQTGRMPEALSAILKELLAGLTEITEQTIDEGTFDGGASISLADEALRMVIGGRLADGRALEEQLKKAAAQLPVRGDSDPKFEFNYETFQGMELHRVLVPAKIADPMARRVLGDSLVITIATGPKSFMVSLDPDGDATLKAAIDRTAAATDVKASPFHAVVEVGQVLAFVQAISPSSIVDVALQKIQQFSAKDNVELSSLVIPGGAVYRISIEEGVLQAAGSAAKAGGGGGGGF
jgi:hypothetical protein